MFSREADVMITISSTVATLSGRALNSWRICENVDGSRIPSVLRIRGTIVIYATFGTNFV